MKIQKSLVKDLLEITDSDLEKFYHKFKIDNDAFYRVIILPCDRMLHHSKVFKDFFTAIAHVELKNIKFFINTKRDEVSIRVDGIGTDDVKKYIHIFFSDVIREKKLKSIGI
jgi:hypothetical protein